jgi:glucan biosynthesis protein C
MDQLRAILMLAGIPYHVGLVYASHSTWIVASPDKSEMMTWLIQFSHTFRMPAFFLLAGLFAMLVVRRRGPGTWMKGRLQRLGVPLATSLLVISPLMVMAGAVAGGGVANALPGLIDAARNPSAAWTVHLWFLIYLLFYCGAFAALWRFFGAGRIERATAAVQAWIARRPLLLWTALLCLGLATLAAAVAAKLLDAMYLFGGILLPAELLANGLVFLSGACIAARPEWLDAFSRPRWPVWAAAFASAVVMAYFQDGSDDVSRILTYFLMPVVGILFSHVLLSAAREWLDHRTRLSIAMVDASMTMYLVHVAIVLWLSVAFVQVPWPAELEILLIVMLSASLSYAFHRLVGKSVMLTFLFNGTRLIGRNGIAPTVLVPDLGSSRIAEGSIRGGQ